LLVVQDNKTLFEFLQLTIYIIENLI